MLLIFPPSRCLNPRPYDCDRLAPIITEDKTAADGSLFDIVQQMSLDWTPARVPPRKTHVGATVPRENCCSGTCRMVRSSTATSSKHGSTSVPPLRIRSSSPSLTTSRAHRRAWPASYVSLLNMV